MYVDMLLSLLLRDTCDEEVDSGALLNHNQLKYGDTRFLDDGNERILNGHSQKITIRSESETGSKWSTIYFRASVLWSKLGRNETPRSEAFSIHLHKHLSYCI